MSTTAKFLQESPTESTKTFNAGMSATDLRTVEMVLRRLKGMSFRLRCE